MLLPTTWVVFQAFSQFGEKLRSARIFITPRHLTMPTPSRRPAAELMTERRQWVATMILLVWVKLMNPLQAVFQDFFLLVKMIALMIGTRSHPSGRPVFATFL